MIDQPGRAVGAGKAEAAGAAQRQRRVAAAIEKQQRLLAALQRDLHRAGQHRRNVMPRRRRFAAQIDRLDGRQALAAETLGQRQPLIASAPRVHFGLDRRRRRRQHHRDAGDVAAHHRHVAGVIAHAVLLLVGGVVLLIDDDQPEIGVGQKQRRARADDDGYLPFSDSAPGARAPARRELRMPFRRARAEARGEAVEKLRGERDFRHEDQALPAAADRVGHRLEINFGLARAGDAVEQRDRIAALGERGFQLRGGGALRGRKIRLREIRIGLFGDRLRRQHHGFQRAIVDQPVDHAGADARLARGLASSPAPCRRREVRARGGALWSCAAAARRQGARRRARARRPDARPCAGTCAAPCRANSTCSSPPNRRSCAVRSAAAAVRVFPRRP